MQFFYLIDKEGGRVAVKASGPIPEVEGFLLVESPEDVDASTHVYDFGAGCLCSLTEESILHRGRNEQASAALALARGQDDLANLATLVGRISEKDPDVAAALELLIRMVGIELPTEG